MRASTTNAEQKDPRFITMEYIPITFPSEPAGDTIERVDTIVGTIIPIDIPQSIMAMRSKTKRRSLLIFTEMKSYFWR